MNKVFLHGRLGKDPEEKMTQSGMPITTLTVATSKKVKDGEEKTTWHRIKVFNKQALACGTYLAKGREVIVEGSINNYTYDKDGTTMYGSEVLADQVTFVGGKNENQSERDHSGANDAGMEDIPF